MTQKRRLSSNRAERLLPRLQTIHVCDEKRQLFLDVFSCSPKNISQQPLGYVFGLFSIDPKEKDAAYIVNFLTSVVKKEYYARPSRNPAESFEAALKKLNLALGEIVKEGNDSWLGTLDGVICAVAQNTVHFTSCGKGHLFLIRDGKFMALAAPEDDIEPHPLKTFEDVASGKIMKEDLFIACDHHLLDLFSFDELSREATRHNPDSLFRLLHTALINECELAGSLMANIQLNTAPQPIKRSSKSKETAEVPTFNAFGQNASTPTKKKKEVSPKTPTPISNSDDLQSDEYVDKKTGHIYIKQDSVPEPTTAHSAFIERCQDVGHAISEKAQSFTRSRLSMFFAWLRTFLPSRSDDRINFDDYQEDELSRESHPEQQQQQQQQQLGYSEQSIEYDTDELPPSLPWHEKARISLVTFISAARSLYVRIFQNIRSRKFPSLRKTSSLLPSFSRMRTLFKKLSYERKVLAVVILLLIVTTPFFLNRPETETRAPDFIPPAAEPEETPFWSEQWEQESDVVFAQVESATVLSEISDPIVNAYDTNDARIFLTENAIFTQSKDTEQTTKTDIPFLASSLIDSTYMQDLSLIFFLTEDSGNNRFYSFSPITNEITENALPLPESLTATKISSYLTYIYAIDENGSTLCRFPRTTGGFEDCTNWLDGGISAPRTKAWDIEGSIYFLTPEGNVATMFGGSLTDFSLSETFIPFDDPDDIYIASDEDPLYLLDQNNGRIARINNESGAVTRNIVSEDLIGARKILATSSNMITLLAPDNTLLTVTWQ